jgi:hypothetical protein
MNSGVTRDGLGGSIWSESCWLGKTRPMCTHTNHRHSHVIYSYQHTQTSTHIFSPQYISKQTYTQDTHCHTYSHTQRRIYI